jgi:transposase
LAVCGVIESMTGARFVHDRLEELGWDVLIADAAKVKGLAPLACKTDKIDARVLAVLQAVKRAPAAYDKAEAEVREQQRAARQPAEPDTDDGIGDELDEDLDEAA